MKIKRAYKVELDLNNKQRTACLRHAGAVRFAYNWGLRRKITAYEESSQTLTAIELHRELNVLKQTAFPWLYEVSKCAPQEALRDLDRAFQNFFRRVENGEKPGFPRFKSRKRGAGSFRLTGTIRVSEKHIQLLRLGQLRLKERGYLPVESETLHIFSATVSERAGRWYVSLQVEEEIPTPSLARGEPVGIDLGIKALATCSDSRVYQNPKALYKADRKLRRLQRTVSRRQPGGKNRRKAVVQLRKQHERVANIRHDALHKATSSIVAKTKPNDERPCAVVLEDLNVSGMLKNHRLARAIADVGMHEFRRQMTYKTAWYGVDLLIADRWYPSSRMCSHCGSVRSSLALSERIYLCPACGLALDRDLNAAINLSHLALPFTERSPTASSAERAMHSTVNACGENVRPAGAHLSVSQAVSSKPAPRRWCIGT